MNLFKKLIIGVFTSILLLVGATTVTAQQKVSSLEWVATRQIEKAAITRIPSDQIIAGDSIILYQGQPAILEDIYIKYVPYLIPYTTSGSTDTVKVYGTYQDIPVQIGYIADTLFASTTPNVSYSSTVVGQVDGDLYYIIMPSGKFTLGDAYMDIISKFIIFK